MFSAPQCDENRSVYVRPYIKLGTDVIVRVSNDGQRITRFDPNGLDGFKGAEIWDYSPAGDGRIAAVMKNHNENVIVDMSSDGVVTRTIKLDPLYIPLHVVEFANGNLFVMGWLKGFGAESSKQHPFQGVFNERGQVLRQVQFNDDAKDTKLSADPLLSIGATIAHASPDGTVYAMRHTARGPVYVISSSGTVDRKIPVRAPDGFQINDFHVTRHALVFTFMRSHPQGENALDIRIVVQNLNTGDKVAEYSADDPALGVGLACYSEKEFTFVGADEQGLLSIISANPKEAVVH